MMLGIDERFDKIERKISEPSFMKNMGLGNEVGYYIFDYSPADELYVRDRVVKLAEKFNSSGSFPKIVLYDLYEIVINILQEKGYLEMCDRFEKKSGFERITKAVSDMLRVSDTEGNLIIERIKSTLSPNSIVFLTGVGKCYPIIRSHNILNNLHQVIDDVPVVLFYPGKFDGQTLLLFNEIKDDNYYRAFPLVD
ncbi:MAG: DUF1788 domain-containing protein [Christensenellaceae bacterium]